MKLRLPLLCAVLGVFVAMPQAQSANPPPPPPPGKDQPPAGQDAPKPPDDKKPPDPKRKPPPANRTYPSPAGASMGSGGGNLVIFLAKEGRGLTGFGGGGSRSGTGGVIGGSAGGGPGSSRNSIGGAAGGGDSAPESPPGRGADGNKACPKYSDKGPCDEEATPGFSSSNDTGATSAPQSVREDIPLGISPNEPGLSTGSLVYYVEAANSNFGDPAHLAFYSIPTMSASVVEVSSTLHRYTVRQETGARIEFDITGSPYQDGLPRGDSANTQYRITYVNSAGVPGPRSSAAKLRQYIPGGCFVDFPLGGGKATGYTTETGRSYSIPVDGFEIIRIMPDGTLVTNGNSTDGVLRQVRTRAGLLDIVPIGVPSRNFKVCKYAPAQIGSKVAGLWQLAGTPPPMPIYIMNVNAPSGTTNQVTIIRSQGGESYTTTHTVSAIPGGERWVQNHTNGDFQFTRTLDRKPTANPGEWDSEWTGKLTQVPSGYTMAPATVTGATGSVLYKLTTLSKSYFPTTSTESYSNGASLNRTFAYATTPWDTTGVGRTQSQTTSTGSLYGYNSHISPPYEYLKLEFRSWTINSSSGPVNIQELYTYGQNEPYSIPLQFDFRPRSTQLTYNSTTVSRQYASYALLPAPSPETGNEYTEIHETDVTPAALDYGNSANIRTVERYYSASNANPLLRGRLREIVHSDGTRTRHTYTAPAAGELLQTIEDRLLPSTGAPSSSSVRVENRYDIRGCLLWGVHSRWVGGAWLPYERFDLAWDNYNNVTQQKRTDLLSNQEVILLDQVWDGARLMSIVDETGIARSYTYFPSSIIVQSIKREAVPATGAMPAQPEVVTTYTGQFTMNTTQLPVWKNLTATVTGGTSSVSTSMVLDHLGRVTSFTDDNGYTTSTNYSANGTTITTTYPSGATRVESRTSDGTLLSVTGSAQVPEFYTSQARGGTTGGMIHLTTIGGPTDPRWFKSETDGAGRQVKTSSPAYNGGTVVSETAFDGCACSGKPSHVTSTGQPNRVYEYNEMRELFRSGQSVNSTLTLASATDTISESATSLSYGSGKLWEVSESRAYPTAGSNVYKTTGTSRRLLAGFAGDERSVTESVDMAGNTAISKSFLNRSQRLATQTTAVPGVSDNTVSVQYAGRAYSTHQSGSSGNTIFTQDGLGRLLSVKQPHHSASESIVYASGKNRILSESDATGASSSYTYVAQGQPGAGGVLTVTAPDSTATTYTYDAGGRVTSVLGTGTYTVSYEYNSYGELWKMRTYSYPSAPGDLTTWNYQPATGLLLNKTDANGKVVSYTYDVANRPYQRTWARGITTTWTYNFGRVYQISYSDGSPGSTFNFDRLGRPTSTTQDGGHSWVYAYDFNTLLPDTETITYGNGTISRVIDRGFDSLRRFNGWSLKTISGSSELNYARTYETVAGRLGTIVSGSDTWTYGYEPAAPGLPKTLTGPGSLSMTNTWEPNRDVLDIKENKFGATTVSKYDYTVNPMRRRSNLAQTGTAYSGGESLAWGYNPRGEVTLHDHSNASYDRVYEFDGIGNRKKGATGTNLPASDDTVSNALNQYTVFPGASGGLTYDFDGNLSTDGGANSSGASRTYTWDGQNQLKQVTATTAGTVQYGYDPMGRRIQKIAGGVTTWYIYDGWNLIAEYQSGTLQRTHLWGTDLSRTAQGAGGVGGLLCSTISGIKYYPLYDGNGNICQYLNASGGTTATFEYGPFGALNAFTGSPALFNFRFSTKYLDLETDNHYYGYRYYSAWMGRWLNRDPIGERGGGNLYAILVNSTIQRVDRLGLIDFDDVHYPIISDCEALIVFGHRGDVKKYFEFWKNDQLPSIGSIPAGTLTCGNGKDPNDEFIPEPPFLQIADFPQIAGCPIDFANGRGLDDYDRPENIPEKEWDITGKETYWDNDRGKNLVDEAIKRAKSAHAQRPDCECWKVRIEFTPAWGGKANNFTPKEWLEKFGQDRAGSLKPWNSKPDFVDNGIILR